MRTFARGIPKPQVQDARACHLLIFTLNAITLHSSITQLLADLCINEPVSMVILNEMICSSPATLKLNKIWKLNLGNKIQDLDEFWSQGSGFEPFITIHFQCGVFDVYLKSIDKFMWKIWFQITGCHLWRQFITEFRVAEGCMGVFHLRMHAAVDWQKPSWAEEDNWAKQRDLAGLM